MLGAVSCNGKIYVMGGSVDGNNASCLTTVEEFDPITNVWTPKKSLPVGRNRARLAVVKGYIM
jgi:N-acetylneuraminic acid mutarotase